MAAQSVAASDIGQAAMVPQNIIPRAEVPRQLRTGTPDKTSSSLAWKIPY
jgi:hypothetical protein